AAGKRRAADICLLTRTFFQPQHATALPRRVRQGHASLLFFPQHDKGSMKRPHLFVVSVALLLSAAVACKSDPKQEALKHVARGDQYVGQGKAAEAFVEYRTAIANDPNHGEAHYKVAHLYMKRGDVREAYGEYVRAADLLPDRDDVQLN